MDSNQIRAELEDVAKSLKLTYEATMRRIAQEFPESNPYDIVDSVGRPLLGDLLVAISNVHVALAYLDDDE